MPNLVIAAMEAHTESKKQPLIEGGCPKFEWQPNIPIPNGIITALNILAIAANVHVNAHVDLANEHVDACVDLANQPGNPLGNPIDKDCDADLLVDFGPQHPLHQLDNDEPVELAKEVHVDDIAIFPNIPHPDNELAPLLNAVSDDGTSTVSPADLLRAPDQDNAGELQELVPNLQQPGGVQEQAALDELQE